MGIISQRHECGVRRNKRLRPLLPLSHMHISAEHFLGQHSDISGTGGWAGGGTGGWARGVDSEVVGPVPVPAISGSTWALSR